MEEEAADMSCGLLVVIGSSMISAGGGGACGIDIVSWPVSGATDDGGSDVGNCADMLMSNNGTTHAYIALTIRGMRLQRHRREKTLPTRLLSYSSCAPKPSPRPKPLQGPIDGAKTSTTNAHAGKI
jgi:hypothetical protein